MENLDYETLQSFYRVLETSHDSNSTISDENVQLAIKEIREEAKNTRIVLRSRGEPFPFPSDLQQTQPPPFVVGLAHHQPTDTFILFAFTSKIMPCRLVRFDRDGEVVEKDETEMEQYLWSKMDASAFVAAVDLCEDGESTFFSRKLPSSSPTSNADGIGSKNDNENSAGEAVENPKSDDEKMESPCISDFLRLVANEEDNDEDEDMSEEEENSDEESNSDEDKNTQKKSIASIKSLILNQLLQPKNNSLAFIHPDPQFLVPLSVAISKELQKWRSYCKHLPPAPDFKGMLQKASDDFCEKTEEGEFGNQFESGTVEWKEFNDIMQQRNEQIASCVEICKVAIKKIEPLLNTTNDDTEQFGQNMMSFGKATVGFIAALDFRQQQFRQEWSDFHEGLSGNFCDPPAEFEMPSLRHWLEANDGEDPTQVMRDSEAGNSQPEQDKAEFSQNGNDSKDERGSKEGEKDKEPRNIVDAASEVFDSWCRGDKALLQSLSNALSRVEYALRSGEEHSRKTALDSIHSFDHNLKLVVEDGRKSSAVAVETFVRIWNSDDENDDNETPWMMSGPWPRWSSEMTESVLSFGHSIGDQHENDSMHFAVDFAEVEFCLESCIEDLSSSHLKDSQFDLLRTEWNEKVLPSINSTISVAKQLLISGDLLNSSLLIVSCSRVLCLKSSMAKIRKCFKESDDANEINGEVIKLVQSSMRKLNCLAIKVSFCYANELFRGARALLGVHWFYSVLKSTAIYFPAAHNKTEIYWVRSQERYYYDQKLEPRWQNCSHIARSIFDNAGWEHPLLCRALKGDALAIQKFSNMEAGDVLKYRFETMKGENKKSEALCVARMMKGDKDALHFLFINGKMDEAIVQASLSRDVEGLATLGADLVSSNPYASLLCMQANFLCSIKLLDEQNWRLAPAESIDTLIGLFFVKQTTDDPNVENCVDDYSGSNRVPSLRLLSLMSLCQSFLCRAKSTTEMQQLIEREKFGDCDISVAAASISILMTTPLQADDDESLKHFLDKANLFSVSNNPVHYSGLLTIVAQASKLMKKKTALGVCCMIYEAGKFLFSKGCNKLFCFEASLFAAVEIAFITGCDSFALERLHWIRGFDAKNMDKEYLRSPLNCLTACFSKLFLSYSTHEIFCRLSENLLLTFFELTPPYEHDNFINYDVQNCRIWVTVAYLQYQPIAHVTDCLTKHLMSDQDNKTPNERQLSTVLNQISTVDMDDLNTNHLPILGHTMEAFAASKHRKHVTNALRNELCSEFVNQVFKNSEILSPCSVANLVRMHRRCAPSFWQVDRDQVEQRLSDPSGLASILSKKNSLGNMYLIVIFVLHSLNDGETWTSCYFILACGISWLRASLQGDNSLIQFDRSEPARSKFDRFLEDWTELLDHYHWEIEDPYSYNYIYSYRQKNNHFHEGRPKFMAFSLINLLKNNLPEVEESAPFLSHLCQETLTLCCVLEFLIEPSMHRFEEVMKLQNSSTTGETIHPNIHYDHLASIVTTPEWGCKPDLIFDSGTRYHVEKKLGNISYLVPRIEIALHYSKLREAQDLCVIAGENKFFWKFLFDKSDCDYRNTVVSQYTRDLVQGCLLILKSTVAAREELTEPFLRIASNIILAMNWFRSCPKCSPISKDVSEDGLRLIPSFENFRILHEVAFAWNDVTDKELSENRPALSFCFSVLSCISRCCTWIDDSSSFVKDCSACQIELKEDRSTQSCMSSREERAKLRKKRKWMSTCNMESDFKELESYASQVHLNETSVWCEEALQRINKSKKK